jgi:hypothetical protein
MLERPQRKARGLRSAPNRQAAPAERRRARWHTAKQRQRRRWRDGEAVCSVRYDGQRVEFLTGTG